jgi:hypothetical protein
MFTLFLPVLVVSKLASRQKHVFPIAFSLDNCIVIGFHRAVLKESYLEVFPGVLDAFMFDEFCQFIIPAVTCAHVACPPRPNT